MTVVVWHWQHFFFHPGETRLQRIDVQPFFRLLRPFYEAGYLAVDFFFVLSGFIFYTLYSEKIQRREMPAWDFAVLRFSRLYPLHFVALIAVAILQLAYKSETGTFFIFSNNTIFTFVQHVLFISGWGGAPDSFNGPVWSVSIELVLYGTFFLICRWFPNYLPLMTGGIVAVAIYPAMRFSGFGRGFYGFFVGGLVALLGGMQARRSPASVSIPVIGLLVFVGILMVDPISSLITENVPESTRIRMVHAGVELQRNVSDMIVRMGIFPLLVLLLARPEPLAKGWSRQLGVLGDISYASYMLHFPLQVLTVVSCVAFGISLNYSSGIVFVGFFALLLAVSFASFKMLEVPCQQHVRAWLLPAYGRTKNASAVGIR